MGLHEDFLVSERDRELVARTFHVVDPEALPGLISRIPDGAGMPSIVYFYDLKPPKGVKRARLRCAHCYMPIHWKGYVIELSDGSRALLGHDCGEKQFGFDFRRVENVFKGERDRHFIIRRLIAIRSALPAFRNNLEALRGSDPIAEFDRYMDTFRRKFGTLSRVLAKTVRESRGRFMATERVRDEEAEQRDARGADRRAESGLYDAIQNARTPDERRRAVAEWNRFVASREPCWKLQPLDMGSCYLWTVLAPDRTPKQLVEQGIDEIRLLDRDVRTKRSDQWTAKELAALPKLLRSAMAKVDAATRLLTDLDAFTNAKNIKRIAAWATEVEKFDRSIRQDVRADGRALVDDDTDARLELPVWFAAPSAPWLEEFRKVVDGPLT